MTMISLVILACTKVCSNKETEVLEEEEDEEEEDEYYGISTVGKIEIIYMN